MGSRGLGAAATPGPGRPRWYLVPGDGGLGLALGAAGQLHAGAHFHGHVTRDAGEDRRDCKARDTQLTRDRSRDTHRSPRKLPRSTGPLSSARAGPALAAGTRPSLSLLCTSTGAGAEGRAGAGGRPPARSCAGGQTRAPTGSRRCPSPRTAALHGAARPPGLGRPAPRTSRLHGELGHGPLRADDVDGLALVLALVMRRDGRDPERPRREHEVPPVHRQRAPCKARATRTPRAGSERDWGRLGRAELPWSTRRRDTLVSAHGKRDGGIDWSLLQSRWQAPFHTTGCGRIRGRRSPRL